MRKTIFLVVVSTLAAGVAKADGYVLTDLGSLGGPNSTPTDINLKGQVVGESDTADGTIHAFLYDSAGLRDLGSLGGNSTAIAINAKGQVIENSNSRAFLYDANGLHDLGGLGGSGSSAVAINARGQIIGNSNSHAFLYDGTHLRDLGSLGGSNSTASAINDRGQVVGTADFVDSAGNSTPHAFLYDGAGLHDLGACFGLSGYTGCASKALGINADGQIIGEMEGTLTDDSGVSLSFQVCLLYDSLGAQSTPLESVMTLSGQCGVSAINAHGNVMGWSRGYNKYAAPRPFFYDSATGQLQYYSPAYYSSGMALALNSSNQAVGYEHSNLISSIFIAYLFDEADKHDLNTLLGQNHWSVQIAMNINDKGQIIATGRTAAMAASAHHALLLTPREWTYTIRAVANGQGSIISNQPSRLDCGEAVCVNDFAPNTQAILTAQPALGYDFVGWADDCEESRSPSCILAVTGNKTATARFAPTLADVRATPTTVIYRGRSTLAWTSANAISCSATTSDGWSGDVPLAGSLEVMPEHTTTYTLRCLRNGDSVSKSATVTVIPLDAAQECLLNWAEASYPDLFAPPGAVTQVQGFYTYRYYSNSYSYLGISSANNHLYYMGSDGILQDEGDWSLWLTTAGCPKASMLSKHA